MKKTFLTLLLLAACTLAIHAAGKDGETLFARLVAEPSEIYAGDSTLVSVVLYASAPIAKAECTTKFRLSGRGKSEMRQLSIDRDATASRVREGRNIYYTLVWAQYVVALHDVGKYSVPQQKFKATLRRTVRMPDMFDRIMGAQPEYRETQVAGESETLTLEAKEKPLRSTQEMMRSGGGVL